MLTPMGLAASYGSDSIVQAFLDHGADPMHGGLYRDKPLHSAAVYGHESTVQLLVEKGTDVDKHQVITD